jgi:hypothetical protein
MLDSDFLNQSIKGSEKTMECDTISTHSNLSTNISHDTKQDQTLQYKALVEIHDLLSLEKEMMKKSNAPEKSSWDHTLQKGLSHVVKNDFQT